MRTTYTIAKTDDINALIGLADAMADSLLGNDYDRAKEGIATARDTLTGETESPFLRYRAEIMGGYSTAIRLQNLVLHLWNDNYGVRLASLFGNADERHTGIALELIASYATNGENDPVFMRLAAEILDLREANQRRAEAEADAC